MSASTSRLNRIARILVLRAALLGLVAASAVRAQTIQPVIQEYTEKADGKFEVTNDTSTPMAVVLEPKSFSISDDGKGIFRQLDANIHVSLSTTSIRLQPKETYYVFYKAKADSLPAWFTVYAAFTPLSGNSAEGVKVRIMLPHTVYLYQKKPINKETIRIADATYEKDKDAIVCNLQNTGPSLVRVQQVRVVAGKTDVISAGFPLLPGASRRVSVEWNKKEQPEFLLLTFPHFDMKEPLVAKDQ